MATITFFHGLSSVRQSDDDDSFRELSSGSTSGIGSSIISSGSSFSFFGFFFSVSLLGRFSPLVGPSYLRFIIISIKNERHVVRKCSWKNRKLGKWPNFFQLFDFSNYHFQLHINLTNHSFTILEKKL